VPSEEFSRSVRRRAVVLILTTVVVAAAAGLFAHSSPPRYVATASLLVGPVSADVDTVRASQALTATYSQLVLRPQALQGVAGLVQRSPSEVAAASDVTFNTDTRIVSLTVTTRLSRTSRQIASALTAQLTRLVGTVDPTAPGAVRILSAQPQTAVVVTRSVARYALLAAAGWLLLAFGLLAAFSSRRPTAAGDELPSVTPLYVPAPASRLTEHDIERIAEQVKEKMTRVNLADSPDAAEG
jgi:capsular polysaccharide biosynthesis protein